MEITSFQLSIIVLDRFMLDAGKSPSLEKLIFVWHKKPSNSIQKVLKTKTVLYGNYEIIFTIVGSSLLLSSKFKLFAIVVKVFQL